MADVGSQTDSGCSCSTASCYGAYGSATALVLSCSQTAMCCGRTYVLTAEQARSAVAQLG
jgi:hypothetical protein